MIFSRLFGKSDEPSAGERLYVSVVAAARRQPLYTELEVPDTVDGRYDAIVLHMWLILLRLRDVGAAEAFKDQAEEVGQALFDSMIADMDRSLRELGVSDVRVGKRVKDMAKAFYGRLKAYDTAFSGADVEFEQALKRNLYGTVDVQDETLAKLAIYLKNEVKSMASQEDEEILAGRVQFADNLSSLGR